MVLKGSCDNVGWAGQCRVADRCESDDKPYVYMKGE